MKEKPNRNLILWDICCPVVVYLIVFNMAFFFLAVIVGNGIDYMMKQVVVEALCFPLVMHFYKKSPIIPAVKKPNLAKLSVSMLAAAALGVALNNLIALTPLKMASESYTKVNELFYGSTLLIEILAAGILAPMVEEVLYRGVVYKRLRDGFGSKAAIVASAILFGALHFNLVQMVFAIPMGLLFAYAVETTGYLEAAVLGHMAANMVSLMTSETKAAAWMFSHTVPNLLISAVCLGIGSWAVWYLYRHKEKR